MEFKTPTIEDKEEIDRCILADDTRSCDYATANIILWSSFYQVKYAIIDGLFVSHTDEEGGSFCYPLGKGNKKKGKSEFVYSDFPRSLYSSFNIAKYFGRSASGIFRAAIASSVVKFSVSIRLRILSKVFRSVVLSTIP